MDILRKFRKWCRLYVDDIVVVGDTLRDHIDRLRLLVLLSEHSMW
jgi:hypothetical protein